MSSPHYDYVTAATGSCRWIKGVQQHPKRVIAKNSCKRLFSPPVRRRAPSLQAHPSSDGTPKNKRYLPHLPYSPTSSCGREVVNRERHSRRGFPNKVRLARPNVGARNRTTNQQPIDRGSILATGITRRANIEYCFPFFFTKFPPYGEISHQVRRLDVQKDRDQVTSSDQSVECIRHFLK